MGTTNDLHRRNWVRQDNDDLLYRIKMTRRWLYEDGLALTSKYMARVLDPLSITPTRVSPRTRRFSLDSLFKPSCTVCVLHSSARTWFQLLLAVCARSHARI